MVSLVVYNIGAGAKAGSIAGHATFTMEVALAARGPPTVRKSGGSGRSKWSKNVERCLGRWEGS